MKAAAEAPEENPVARLTHLSAGGDVGVVALERCGCHMGIEA